MSLVRTTPRFHRGFFILVRIAGILAGSLSAIPKLNSKETPMSSLRPQDRKSLCRFTFADGRQCRTPRSPHHPHFCSDHARNDSQACAADKLARKLSYFFSGQYLSACDLSAALGRLLPAIVRGDIKPRSARTLAYLSQTLAQTIHLSKHEYTNAFGDDSWRRAVRNSVRQNFNYLQPSPQPDPDQAP